MQLAWGSIFREGGGGGTPLAFLLRSLQYSFLNASFANESVNGDLFRLAQSVRSIHRLLVDRRVPVAVVEDHLQKTRDLKLIQLYY